METDRLSYLLRHEATAHGKEDYKHVAADALESLSAEVESLRATIARLHAVLTAAAEQRQYLNSPYDTGWNDAIRWINQHAAMAGGAHG